MNCDLINAYKRVDDLKSFGIDCSYMEKYGQELNDLCMADNKGYMDTVYGLIDCKIDDCIRYYKTIPYSCVTSQTTVTPNAITASYYDSFNLAYNHILVGPTQTDEFVVTMRIKVNWENPLVSSSSILIKSIVPILTQVSNNTNLPVSYYSNTWTYIDTDINDGKKVYELSFIYYDVTPGYLSTEEYSAHYAITIWDSVNETTLGYTHSINPII